MLIEKICNHVILDSISKQNKLQLEPFHNDRIKKNVIFLFNRGIVLDCIRHHCQICGEEISVLSDIKNINEYYQTLTATLSLLVYTLSHYDYSKIINRDIELKVKIPIIEFAEEYEIDISDIKSMDRISIMGETFTVFNECDIDTIKGLISIIMILLSVFLYYKYPNKEIFISPKDIDFSKNFEYKKYFYLKCLLMNMNLMFNMLK